LEHRNQLGSQFAFFILGLLTTPKFPEGVVESSGLRGAEATERGEGAPRGFEFGILQSAIQGRGFKALDAPGAPDSSGHLVDEYGLKAIGGVEFGMVGAAEFVEGVLRLAAKDNGLRVHAMLLAVARGAGFALGGDWASGFRAVDGGGDRAKIGHGAVFLSEHQSSERGEHDGSGISRKWLCEVGEENYRSRVTGNDVAG
jgi:hypothetical protein